MPNWCNNDIRIYGDEKTIKAITNVIKSLGTEDRLFQSLIGLPDNMSKSDYEVKWYDTNLNWFGTKWDVDVNTDCFNFDIDSYDTKIEFNITYEITIFKLIKIKIVLPSYLNFNITEGEISFFCETAWSPPIQFLENLCKMYKVNSYVFYSEGGVGFSGETKLIWQDDELMVEDNEYEYNKGLYLLSNEEFWSNMESNIEYAVEEEMEVDDFLEEYRAYVSEKDIQDLTIMFNETKKEYEERNTEVE
jgi:hypothetical protein